MTPMEMYQPFRYHGVKRMRENDYLYPGAIVNDGRGDKLREFQIDRIIGRAINSIVVILHGKDLNLNRQRMKIQHVDC